MLKKLKISRFKSVRSQELDFGRVNLFIGGNGSGKSNLLEAIGIFSSCLGRGLGDSDIGARGLRITPPELMKSSFKNDDLPKTLELHGEFSDNIVYRVVLQSSMNDPLLRFFSESSFHKGVKVFGRSHRGASATGVSHAERLDRSRGIWDHIKATYNIDPEVNDAFSEFSRYVIYTPQTDFLRGKFGGKVDIPPVGLHGEGLPAAVEGLRRVSKRSKIIGNRRNSEEDVVSRIIQRSIDLVGLPGWARSFGVHRAEPILTSRDLFDQSSPLVYFVDKFMHAKRNRLSVYDSSEGTLFLLFAAIILAHPQAPKIFALDNVDNSLNPALTRKLVERIIEVTEMASVSSSDIGARQVFLTSHNPTALDAFDLFDENVRIFVVSRNERGHTIATRLQPPPSMSREDWQLLMNGRNLSQIWVDGDIPGALGGAL